MNWNKLTKEKRNQLILVLLATVLVLSGLGFGLIRYQYQNIDRLADKKVDEERNFLRMKDAVKHKDQIRADLAVATNILAGLERDMASGDLYSWVINTLRQFKAPYKVEIPQLNPPGPVTEMNLLPGFPYKQAIMSVTGTGHYHDFGRFLADFENQFPHIRVANLNLDLNPTPTAGEQETLSFKMDIITLVKPNP